MVPQGLATQLAEAGRRMDARNWVPGSAGNLSARIDDTRIAITRSGVHKGRLSEADIIAVDYDGKALVEGQKPSAETLLHCQLYRLFPPVGDRTLDAWCHYFLQLRAAQSLRPCHA
jgi:methylthioribulose-1-phosphate dehydratase